MKYFFSSLIILFSTFAAVAQNSQQHVMIRSESPLVLINDSIIGSFRLLNSVSKEQILELDLARDKEIGSKMLFLPEEKKNGLLIARIKKNLKIKTQQELNQFFGLEPIGDIYVNGYLLEDKNISIAVNSMKKVEVIPADDLFLKKPVLNISI